MNTAATVTAAPVTPTVTPRDRLGFTLFLAAVLHALLILGVTFDLPTPSELSRALEITLATQPSEQTPEQADYLAQVNQEGSGTLDEKAAPSTTEEAELQDSEINQVTPAQEASAPPPEPVQPKQIVTTSAASPDRVRRAPEIPDPVEAPSPAQRFDMSRLSQEIASLEAQLAEERQLYAKRPRVHRLNAASTMQDKGAYYKDAWRRKVERVGNQNYPAEARDQRIYGSLRMLVAINRDGTLREVRILESSGHTVLDNAALRIVRLAAPYAPFTGDLIDVDVLEIIRTWRFERGDRVSSF
ncbi:energy transducer TonB [Halopseudomonas nanhaiensis]|uniref:energy transducer TonB n=1 Tax=Halopseudomonas nanhaiensis TaxID=2830842 RepID=UPI001CBD1F62|nr:energy transducer TonB [Halopseudomonas nanhaiensis]UAW98238.1 energy transducer TonB [Halopseudomonas nanhaiensis]